MEKSIQEKLDELTETVDKLFPKDRRLVSELTVEELKLIIRQIVREEVNYKSMPVQPFYYQPLNPYESQRVWCTDKTTPADLHEPTCIDKTIGEIDG